jgi:hypothetical protein
MELSRKEKEGILLDLYHNKGYTYRQIAEELRMSFNQISDILKSHEERNNAIANKRKELSLSSKAYKLFSKGKTNVEVVIKLDVPQAQVTQFRLEYCKLQDLDNFESLYRMTNGNVNRLLALYRELVIKRKISFERIANLVDIALKRLPNMETLFEQAKRAADRQQERLDYLENRIRSLGEEEKRRKGMITLHPSSYYYPNDRENPAANAFPYNIAPRQSASLPYWPSGYPDLSNEYREAQETGREERNSRDL